MRHRFRNSPKATSNVCFFAVPRQRGGRWDTNAINRNIRSALEYLGAKLDIVEPSPNRSAMWLDWYCVVLTGGRSLKDVANVLRRANKVGDWEHGPYYGIGHVGGASGAGKLKPNQRSGAIAKLNYRGLERDGQIASHDMLIAVFGCVEIAVPRWTLAERQEAWRTMCDTWAIAFETWEASASCFAESLYVWLRKRNDDAAIERLWRHLRHDAKQYETAMKIAKLETDSRFDHDDATYTLWDNRRAEMTDYSSTGREIVNVPVKTDYSKMLRPYRIVEQRQAMDCWAMPGYGDEGSGI